MGETKLKIDDGVEKIAIYNQEDELLTVLKVNTSDADTAERFGKIIDNLQEIAGNCEKEAEAWREEHAQDEGQENSGVDVEHVLQINRIRVKYLKQIADEIDRLFGAGTVQSIYGDIVPDEAALVKLIEDIIPVMNNLFGRRYEMTHKRYSSGRKGAGA